MADLTITAANVVAGSGAKIAHGTAGAAITAGQTVYADGATNSYKLADVNSATVDVRNVAGIALHAASPGQPLAIVTEGLVTIGATLTPGVDYYASGTPGGIRPVADNTTGDYPVRLGMAKSATVLDLSVQSEGVAL